MLEAESSAEEAAKLEAKKEVDCLWTEEETKIITEDETEQFVRMIAKEEVHCLL
jgi:hypothetical protein